MTAPSLSDYIRATFQAVVSCLSLINSSPSLLFCAIVAVTDCNFGRPHWPEIDFREFQEYGPQNNASQAKMYIRRSNTEVGVVAAYHLGGLLGGRCGCER